MHKLFMSKKAIGFLALAVALSVATPVLADYLGPNRTVTTTVCKVVIKKCELVDGDYKDRNTGDDWSCSNEGKPWETWPNHATCKSLGDIGNEHWEHEDRSETTTHPSATIAGTVNNCTLVNGWCNGSSVPELALTAKEPLLNQSIMQIEGTRNAVDFVCTDVPPTSCSLDLVEGDNHFEYWAHSTWGDTSVLGVSNARVDRKPPEISLNVTGKAGNNPWYVSAITVERRAVRRQPVRPAFSGARRQPP